MRMTCCSSSSSSRRLERRRFCLPLVLEKAVPMALKASRCASIDEMDMLVCLVAIEREDMFLALWDWAPHFGVGIIFLFPTASARKQALASLFHTRLPFHALSPPQANPRKRDGILDASHASSLLTFPRFPTPTHRQTGSISSQSRPSS